MFYVLGAELQGNLSAGRYKRIMTWMVNVPVIAYMIGNMILSARRVADDVETSEAQGYNIGFGIAFIVLALVCIILYATDPLYADEPWFMLTECTLTDNRSYPRMNDAPKFHNNRFMPQFVLHIAVIICLFYFVFVGFINYGADAGWLLTDECVPCCAVSCRGVWRHSVRRGVSCGGGDADALVSITLTRS